MPKTISCLKTDVVLKTRVVWLRPYTVGCIGEIRRLLLANKALGRSEKSRLRSVKFITVAYVSLSEVERLNFEFRGKKKPTDILSFEGVETDSLGELVVAMPLIRSQAKDNKHSIRSELSYILLHGVLHLLGLDHGKKMFAIQDEVFETLREARR